MEKQGKIFILSGPSGCGKGTVLKSAMREHPDMFLSVSATTRGPRQGEIDGVHYHFIDDDAFLKMIDRDQLLEHAGYAGNFYGTPRIPVDEALDQGRDVFAVPGPIDAAASVGCNRLIRDGAGLAASGWDILSVYHSRFPHRLHPAQMTVPEPGETPRQEESPPPAQTPEPEAPAAPELPVLDLDRNREGLTDDQLALIRVLDTETPLLTDEAAEQTGLPVRRVLSALTVLEIDGYAQRSGPRSYVRTVRLHSEKEGS